MEVCELFEKIILKIRVNRIFKLNVSFVVDRGFIRFSGSLLGV